MKKLTSLTLTLVLILSLFTACGGSAKSEAAAPMDYAVMEEEAMEAPAAMNGSLTESGTGGSATLPEGRKWVITVTMSAETDDLDTMTAELDKQISVKSHKFNRGT